MRFSHVKLTTKSIVAPFALAPSGAVPPRERDGIARIPVRLTRRIPVRATRKTAADP